MKMAGNSTWRQMMDRMHRWKVRTFKLCPGNPSGTLSGVCVEGRVRTGITSPSMLRTKFALCFTFWASCKVKTSNLIHLISPTNHGKWFSNHSFAFRIWAHLFRKHLLFCASKKDSAFSPNPAQVPFGPLTSKQDSLLIRGKRLLKKG